VTDPKPVAPGSPGIPPRWTSSAKSGVGTSLNPSSRVWFTLSHGILDEVYFPRVDQACIRDLGLLITDGGEFFSEEKRDTKHALSTLARGVPAYHLENTCSHGRYKVEKDIITDPNRPVVLQRIRFEPLVGKSSDYHLYALLAPHLGNHGSGNTAWTGDYKGTPMLFAERQGNALALACSSGWLKRSAGFVGVSDGWQDISQHQEMTWSYERAPNGNVALAGEVDLASSQEGFVLALGFGRTAAEAGFRALASLHEGFDSAQAAYIREWQEWQKSLWIWSDSQQPGSDVLLTSSGVLRIHEAKRFPGGLIASLAIPWGFAKGDEDLGGYHLVWPRDLVESASGLLAVGAREDARRVLHYLDVTQEADGHWPQNMWLDGTTYWSGVQLDETAFPILLVDLAKRERILKGDALRYFWPMVRRAAAYLYVNGPVTQEDRWEEDPGYSPFTLAVEIAGLLAAADFAQWMGEKSLATRLQETADVWNELVEARTYVSKTDLAQKIGIEGYYVRIAPPENADAASPVGGFVPIKNRPPGQSELPAEHIISPDALALVRFGLRAADDPHILNTIQVIDALLKTETPFGPAWHRYNDDGYGEHEDGTAFNGTGIGRAWPLLTGERAHYELAAGRSEEAKHLLEVLKAFSNEGHLLSEQIWDKEDLPEHELFFGRPSGSAMPLVWAHAEYAKLCRSLKDDKVFDMPPQPVERYQVQKVHSKYTLWRFSHKSRGMPVGNVLRIEVPKPAVIHWSSDDWQTTHDLDALDSSLGLYTRDLPTQELPSGSTIRFTLYWSGEKEWLGKDFEIDVREAEMDSTQG
jgi:glucoamylase